MRRELTLLTMTGERPEAFELCKRWMRAQDFDGEVNWIVVDDGREITSLADCPRNWNVFTVLRRPKWSPGQNTQHDNILAGLELVESSANLVVIEDDDYYAPGYLSAVSRWLEIDDLVGEGFARYWNVRTGGCRSYGNDAHASLCSTAMKGEAITLFANITREREKFIDMALWRRFGGRKKVYPAQNVVGVKGLPGRGGIGKGHELPAHHGKPDWPRQWIGNDIGEILNAF